MAQGIRRYVRHVDLALFGSCAKLKAKHLSESDLRSAFYVVRTEQGDVKNLPNPDGFYRFRAVVRH